jgi:uncharacterized protein YbjT (DUF2867 family)
MASVLVTGGTGTLGRALVPLLAARGHDVRVLSRRSRPVLPAGVTGFPGDVRTGAGIERAVRGADVVVHAASSPARRAMDTEVAGSRNIAAAAATVGAHVVYISIVGVDRHRYAYYRAKRAAELVIEGAAAPWTVLRATQFHNLISTFLRSGWFIRTPGLAFQPVHVDEVAARLVDIAEGPPLGYAPDFGGPEVLPIDEIVEQRAAVTGRRTRLVRVPRFGFVADFDAGRHLAPDHRSGTLTWREWLQTT